MINTQITSQISNLQKNDSKTDNNTLKDKTGSKNSSKQSLTEVLKENLTSNKNINKEEIAPNFSSNQINEKLKELINKLLNQINAQKNPNSPMLKQGKNLNLAPNFANELKNLSTELAKNDIFTQVLNKLNTILKPASEIKNDNLAPLLKNSGVFLEAKLKDALNEELLPKSFHSLLSAIKGLSNKELSNKIAQLADTNLSPKDALKELKNIIDHYQNQNKTILNKSSFKILLQLSTKLENFKNYISKNPSHAQEKIIPLAHKISKELNSIKHHFSKTLNKSENLLIKDTTILKQVANAFEKLENTLKNILERGNLKNQNKIHLTQNSIHEQNPSKYKHQNIKENSIENKTKNSSQPDEKNHEINPNKQITSTEKKDNKDNDGKIKYQKNNHESNNIKENNTKQENEKNIENKVKDLKNNFKESHQINKDFTPNNKEYPKTNNIQNMQQNTSNNQNILKNQDFIQQNIIKNLAFSTENLDLNQAQDLSKHLNHLFIKINKSLLELDPQSQNAKSNQIELKHLEHKLNHSLKDLAQIKSKTNEDIADSLHHDVKSTLLQISNLAKNENNEAIYNQANRLLAQLEINQLMSLANDSINTYLPFSWEDLNDSKIIFRRGKKDKFFAQIKLEFAKLGNLEILLSLNNEKYIDINIMAENIEFRKTIYENAHTLKRNINKAGLLSGNFFIGDIIKNKFDAKNIKNLDLEIGMDKKV
ncbi:flagellar hook-length control protein FliK [Campylobacter hepaticus]|uniref:flagellar hook-length control protein FliK n=1 Tax=Campylobacter hepaticus TaxID=1813019 RepID=UPI0022A7CE74|nr:flagellar hook-length control protein FliK [Campylobacter hepaticus]MCZ0772449.1 flagellar hook-length control protein FliK [Campylobacter hepaticus]MCZ0773917.1 flagellar hook-length control protein FliK [Campylobacter hepaticus]MCZ0775168.1 flagellar hook-length control protein FliK [Campylobacter hepaticus]WAP50145.1 flagellar hook-length control protein FliK [Campylobacter hepaticus]